MINKINVSVITQFRFNIKTQLFHIKWIHFLLTLLQELVSCVCACACVCACVHACVCVCVCVCVEEILSQNIRRKVPL